MTSHKKSNRLIEPFSPPNGMIHLRRSSAPALFTILETQILKDDDAQIGQDQEVTRSSHNDLGREFSVSEHPTGDQPRQQPGVTCRRQSCFGDRSRQTNQKNQTNAKGRSESPPAYRTAFFVSSPDLSKV